ncbi:hypothetical protein Q7C_2165 [Methylophaga frappieri]|uniref:Lipoprotein n=1 Tax=Methylophaga frappieri (strain ATCC BAA-2434 / DSM 25690 / JAM7) TaxID=754477 RepID=I1YK58_METFJ|nr:hypothetical protein [Methylophaga frappieri]AFJ03301.1 hypothetical protein Q7C_2165 [Methylophaga frappieri]
MLNRMRLLLTSLFISFALIACSNDESQDNDNDAVEETAADVVSTDDTAGNMSESAEMDAQTADNVERGMTEAQLLEMLGEPDLKQVTGVDSFEVIFYEWETDEGLLTVQLHNGAVAFSQFEPK